MVEEPDPPELFEDELPDELPLEDDVFEDESPEDLLDESLEDEPLEESPEELDDPSPDDAGVVVDEEPRASLA